MTGDLEGIRTTRLPNGTLVLTETMPGVESVALGVWTDAGSIDETDGEFGLAHFLEHMLFKGTTTRSAFELAEAIEDVGGQLNAYTERDTPHMFGRVLAEHMPVALELLADMICHSTFEQAELERERQVVIEEIRKYESLPEERIHDLIMEALWSNGSLAHPILGSEASVQGFTCGAVETCWRRHFAAERVLVTAAGRLEHDHFVELVANHFADLPGPQITPAPYLEGEIVPRLLVSEEEDQVHFCWGGRSYPVHDDRNYTLAIVDAVLGASCTSRLFQEIREKRGLAYDVSSYTMGFRETGLFCATVTTSSETLLEVLTLVKREIEGLRRQGITAKELARAKEQFKSGIALALESTAERMRRLANHQMTWKQILPISTLIQRVNAVTLDDVNAVIDEVMDVRQWSYAAIGEMDDEKVMEILG